MPGYEYQFVEPIKRRFVCPLCTLPMREAVYIDSCNHHFCDSCLQDYLSEGVFKCPEDSHPLDYAKIYPDQEMQEIMQSTKIHCPHHSKGCRWVDTILNLSMHMDICRFDAVVCPNECGSNLSRAVLQDHLNYTCSRRHVICESCGQEFSGEAMEAHQGNCPQEPVWCENKCGARLQRRYLSNHMHNECHKRTSACRYCNKQFMFETLQDHYYQCPRFPITCPNRCDHVKIPRDEIDRHVRNLCPSATVPCPFKHVGCKHMCPRFGLDKHVEDAMKTHLSLMCAHTFSQERTIETLSAQLAQMSVVSDGSFLWRLDNWSARMKDAKQTVGLELKSDAFYTNRYGYKLQLSCFPAGNGSGEGTHVSLYIRLLPGDYDNVLDWPFRLPITFRILDQCGDPEKRVHAQESFIPNPSWRHFQKPSQDEDENAQLGFGYPKFLAHDSFRSANYVRDDVLFIKVIVDTTTFIV